MEKDFIKGQLAMAKSCLDLGESTVARLILEDILELDPSNVKATDLLEKARGVERLADWATNEALKDLLAEEDRKRLEEQRKGETPESQEEGGAEGEGESS